MPLLDFEDAKPSQPRKKMRMLLGVGTIAAVVGFGSTFASSISLNSGGNVEFGQGVATTAACDSSIKITPVSEFTNSDASASPSPAAARLPMTVVKIEGVDLTPEGWDESADNYDEHFNPSINPEERSWDDGYEQYAGKYYNGTSWVPTCEGKVLLLRAYTNNPDYGSYTVEGTTESPLWLNVNPGVSAGPFGMVPASATEVNAGVGIRIYRIPETLFDPELVVDALWITDLFVNDGGFVQKYSFSPIDIGGVYGSLYDDNGYIDSSWWTNPTVEIRLLSESYIGPLMPVDSRLVDKLSVESTAKKPSDWQLRSDLFGQLNQVL